MTRRQRKSVASALKGTALVAALIVALAFLMPRSWARGLAGIAQVLIPFQIGSSSARDVLTPDAIGSGLVVSPEEYAATDLARQAAEHRAAVLALRVQQLEDEVQLLTASRLWDVSGTRLGASGRLIPARVIGDDLLFWRSSKLIDAGRSRGASRGNPVLSHEFVLDRGAEDGARPGFAIVSGEVLVGFIDHASTKSSRIRLLSDPESGARVRVGRVTEGSFEGPERHFWLVGRGQGRMEIRDAEAEDAASGRIRVGDLVLSDPQDEVLPAAMLIGRVSRIDDNPENPLFATLTVTSPLDEGSLRRVYVYDPGWDDGRP